MAAVRMGMSLVKLKLLMLVFGSQGCRRKDFHKSRYQPAEMGDHQYAPVVLRRVKKEKLRIAMVLGSPQLL